MKRELLSILIAALILLLVALAASAQSVKISDMPAATDPTGTELVPVVQGGANRKMSISQWQNLFPLLSGSYSNPSWLNSLAWSKITGTPTTLSGYGITGAETLQSLRVNGTAGAGFLQMDWQSANPTGAASRTTLWADNSGRLNWRLGTGGSSFIRTFDATGITADRTYTLPDFSGTLLAIGTNALGANNVNLLNGNLLVGPTGATITDNTRLDVRGTGTTSSTFGLRVANSANVTRLTLNDEGTLNLTTTATTHTWIGSSYQGWSSLIGGGGGSNINVGQINSIAGATNPFRFDLSSIPTGGAAMEIRETTSDTNIGGVNSGVFIRTKGGFTRNSGTNTHTHLQLNPTYNTTASYSGTINGIDYNPTLTSLTGATHIAWRNTSGSMLIGGTSLTNANTIFDIQSTTQGLALPRMTDTQRNAISSPYSGLQIHSTTSNRPNWHNGTAWQEAADIGYVLGAKTFTGRQTFATGNNGSLVVGTNTVDDSSPVNGLIMYNTTSNTFRFRQNGAWVGLGGGGGITNSAPNGELMKSDGTNAVSSGITANYTGGGSLALSGSATYGQISSNSSNGEFRIATGILNNTNTSNIVISTGNAQGTSGGYNSGDVLIHTGTKYGTGTRGNVALFTDVSPTWQGMERGIFMSRATNAPTGNPADGAFFYVDPATDLPKWRVPGGTVYTLTDTGAGATYYAPTSLVVHSSNADYTAVANSVLHLPDGVLSANRTLTIPTSANGDVLEIYCNEDTYAWNLAGATVYLADRTTVVTQLLFNVPTLMQRINGLWIIKN